MKRKTMFLLTIYPVHGGFSGDRKRLFYTKEALDQYIKKFVLVSTSWEEVEVADDAPAG